MSRILCIIVMVFSLFGCGGENGGTGGGNPLVASVQSSSYTNDGTLVLFQNPAVKAFQRLFLIPTAYAAVPITDFKFCITKLKVVEEGSAQAGIAVEMIVGLVDISDATVTTSWGKIDLDGDIKVSEIHFEIHTDSENCSGVNYSVSYNGSTITQDLEFKFKFDPAITINQGDTLTLGVSTIAKAMQDASAAGEFTNAKITSYLENAVIGTGSKD